MLSNKMLNIWGAWFVICDLKFVISWLSYVSVPCKINKLASFPSKDPWKLQFLLIRLIFCQYFFCLILMDWFFCGGIPGRVFGRIVPLITHLPRLLSQLVFSGCWILDVGQLESFQLNTRLFVLLEMGWHHLRKFVVSRHVAHVLLLLGAALLMTGERKTFTPWCHALPTISNSRGGGSSEGLEKFWNKWICMDPRWKKLKCVIYLLLTLKFLDILAFEAIMQYN